MNRWTKTCPTCGEPWAVMRHTNLRYLTGDRERQHDTAVICEMGHEFVAHGWYDLVGEQGQALVTMPDPIDKRTALVERSTDEPCDFCGKPIDGGQAYLENPIRHIGHGA